jgi:hypothetical protein
MTPAAKLVSLICHLSATEMTHVFSRQQTRASQGNRKLLNNSAAHSTVEWIDLCNDGERICTLRPGVDYRSRSASVRKILCWGGEIILGKTSVLAAPMRPAERSWSNQQRGSIGSKADRPAPRRLGRPTCSPATNASDRRLQNMIGKHLYSPRKSDGLDGSRSIRDANRCIRKSYRPHLARKAEVRVGRTAADASKSHL